MNVIKVVVPNSTHLLCIFHILKNLSMECEEYVKSHRHEYVIDLLNNIIYSNREYEFLVHLKHFEVVCNDISLFV